MRRLIVGGAALLFVVVMAVPASAVGPPEGVGPPSGFPIATPVAVRGDVTINRQNQTFVCSIPGDLRCGTFTLEFRLSSRPGGTSDGSFAWYEDGDSSTMYTWEVVPDSLEIGGDRYVRSARFDVVYSPIDGARFDDLLAWDAAANPDALPLVEGSHVGVFVSDSGDVAIGYPEAVSGEYPDMQVNRIDSDAGWLEAQASSFDPVDCGNGEFVPCRFYYDATSVFQIGGVPATRADFETALSVFDRADITYRDGAPSTFDLVTDNPYSGFFYPVLIWLYTDPLSGYTAFSWVWEWDGTVDIVGPRM